MPQNHKTVIKSFHGLDSFDFTNPTTKHEKSQKAQQGDEKLCSGTINESQPDNSSTPTVASNIGGTTYSKLLVKYKTEVENYEKMIKKLESDIATEKEKNNQLQQKIETLKRISNFTKLQLRVSHLTGKSLVSQSNQFEAHLSPIFSHPVMHWFAQKTTEIDFCRPASVTMMGDGPITDVNWNNFLHRQNIPISNNSPIIIVGKNGWNPTDLESLIDSDQYDDIEVYSQELFYISMITGKNPWKATLTVLKVFADDHPALNHLLKSGFEWPFRYDNCQLSEPIKIRRKSQMAEVSPLKKLGYSVGMSGLSTKQRQSILLSAYFGKLPYVEDNEYMAEWGFRRTRKRLWRIAHHLTMLIRLNLNHYKDMDFAVEEWKEDLEWLKKSFYKRSMKFDWPFDANAF